MSENIQPSERALQRAQTHWQQSSVDYQQAQKKLKKSPIESSFLSLQTALNAIAAAAILLGHIQLPMHSLTQLANLCNSQPTFQTLLSHCVSLENAGGLNPFQVPSKQTKQQAQEFLQLAKHIRSTTYGWLKQQNFHW